MGRMKRRIPFLIAILAGALLAILGGAGTAATAAAPAPDNTAAPTVTGTPKEGETLTAQTGAWSGTPSPRFTFRWERCDPNAAGCAAISGATSNTYKLVTADVGHVVRVNVTGTNRIGSSSAASSPTSMVAAAKSGSTTVAAADVQLPDRLIVDQLSFSPNPVKSRATTITARFHVSDTLGRSVNGALVYMAGIPFSRITKAAEGPTDANGWAEFHVQPTSRFPIERGGSQVVFVRARTPQGNVLAGSSVRRLVEFKVALP